MNDQRISHTHVEEHSTQEKGTGREVPNLVLETEVGVGEEDYNHTCHTEGTWRRMAFTYEHILKKN